MTSNPATKMPKIPASAIPPSLLIYDYLARNMRADEIEQFKALAFTEFDPETAAVNFWSAGPWALCIVHADGTPAAAGGYRQVEPGIWQSWMVGTERGWSEMWLDIHRATRALTERLVGSGLARRLQTKCLASREQAMSWYPKLGLAYEGTLRGYGAHGEDVALFGRVVPVIAEEAR